MGRNPRIFLPDFPTHVVQRGHDKQDVFTSPVDYIYYLNNLVEAKTRLNVRVYAYCLMTNHVHLILAPSIDACAISTLMKTIAARQTRYANKRLERSGTLWEGRFKASIIDTDRYLLACMRYVDLNPVRAAIVDTPQSYKWSSYRTHVGLTNDGVTDMPDTFRQLGVTNRDRFHAYKDLVAAGTSDTEISLIRSAVQRNQLTGDFAFVERVATKTGRQIEPRGRGRPSKSSFHFSEK